MALNYETMAERVLGFDVGGTKTAWALVDGTGTLLESGHLATPHQPDEFVTALSGIIEQHHCAAVGIGIAGTIQDHQTLNILTNLPELSGLPLAAKLRENGAPLVTLDNDARAALIGEVWQGGLQEDSNAVLLTLGTGVGGAVLRRGTVMPHPTDVTQEIGRLIIDSHDHFPAPTGPGTIEAFLGGTNLEKRFGFPMSELAHEGHAGKKEALELWTEVSSYFHEALRMVQETFNAKRIVIGGKGLADLDLYLGATPPPCPVTAAALGEQAGVYGAARLGLDIFEDTQRSWDE